MQPIEDTTRKLGRKPLSDAEIQAWEEVKEWAEALPRLPAKMRQHRLLTVRQELICARIIQRGKWIEYTCQASPLRMEQQEIRRGHEAQEILICSNLRLVYHEVERHRPRHLEADDLLSAAVQGLGRAVEKFDPTRGRFTTYATWWIRQSLQRVRQTEERLIRLPVHVEERIARIRRAYAELEREAQLVGGESVDMEKVCAVAEEDYEWYRKIHRVMTPVLSLDELTLAEQEKFCAEWIREELDTPSSAFEDRMEDEWLLLQIRDLIVGKYNPKTWDILALRLGIDGEEPKTLDEIGRKYSVTRERIRQIVKKVLADKELWALLGIAETEGENRRRDVAVQRPSVKA